MGVLLLTPDVVVTSPQVDVDCIQDCKKREAPRDAVDNYGFSAREELVDDRAEEEKMDERPGIESLAV